MGIDEKVNDGANLKEIAHWIHLIQLTVLWRALVNKLTTTHLP